MMNLRKNILSVTLSIALAFGAIPSVAPAATDDYIIEDYNLMLESVQQSIEQVYSAERRATETASIMQANQILSSVGNANWYAGQYIDSNGRLHVCTTSNSNSEVVQTIRTAGILNTEAISELNCTAITDSPDVIIENATYSMHDLENILALIRTNRPDFVQAWGIDEQNNCVFVELSEYSEESIQTFKEKVTDSQAVVFMEYDGVAIPQASIYAGTVVYPTSSSRVTITMFAYKDGDFGFITAGHTLGNTIRVSSSGSILGTTSSSNKVRTPTADGSWTKLNSGHTGNDGVAKVGSTQTNYYVRSGLFCNPVQGASVAAYLGRSGAVKTGTITYVSREYVCAYSQINSSWSDMTCSDIYVAGLSSQGGDSGSPLFSTMSSTNMTIWGSLRSGDGTNSSYCNINSVISALDVDCTYTQ